MLDQAVTGSTDDAYPVYTGFWTDWSRGKVLGSTLTLTRGDANLFIAFVAFFLTVVTAQLWSIACFASHSFFSTQDPRDMLHHQRQAILRNNGAPASTAVTLIRLAWAWRRSSSVVRRVIPLLACTVLLAVGFATAAGFSSRIAVGNTVLLKPRNCGVNNGAERDVETGTNIYFPWQAQQHTIALNYAQQCYSTSVTVADCLDTALVRRELATSVDTNASCPFDKTVCSRNSSNLRLDSGFIDSHFDLGVNASPDQRLQFRTVLHCAPLTTRGYRSSYNRPDNLTLSRYHYGVTAVGNFTYEYPIPGQAVDRNRVGNDGVADGLYLNQQYHIFSQSGSLWIDVQFLNGSEPTSSSVRAYLSTEAASPLGCVSQFQYCFPELPAGQNCTVLSGTYDSAQQVLQLGLSNATIHRAFWIHNSFSAAAPALEQIRKTLDTTSLTSRFKLTSGTQGFLPSNQWQLDVKNWNSVILTLYQQSMISTVLGNTPNYTDSDRKKYIQYASRKEEKAICSNQKINSSFHISFSVFGIAVIAFVGFLVIITSLTIEPIAHFIQRRLKQSAYRRLEWVSTGTLQLQRQLYEAHGVTSWRHCDELIPILEEQGALLPVLDISDQAHPSTKRRSQLMGDPKQASGEGLSEMELPEDSDTLDDQDHAGLQMASTEQNHGQVGHHIILTGTETVSVDERTPSLETSTPTDDPQDYRGPASVHDALERRTNTFP
ncbi:hypothetical protein O1611_g9078 [Lasiodiplodia mahajangana]|uniref:Uncharacterized protein n=1 Tax=Lasiodiplodia mahajangana TaxID=1108764 RepID=A0ACC2JB02_9PEZI|nr:hypothetical protein O1611_g9078 [Lasiodiplodia mahajangana]